MDEQQLRKLAAELIEKVAQQDQAIRSTAEAIERDHRELHRRQVKIDQLTHEMAVLRRWKFAARSEQLHGEQRRLLEETIDADLEAMQTELEICSWHRRLLPSRSSSNPNVKRYRLVCRASRCAMNRIA